MEIEIIQGNVIWEEFIWEWFLIFVYHPKFEKKVEFKNYYFSSRHDESFWQSNILRKIRFNRCKLKMYWK